VFGSGASNDVVLIQNGVTGANLDGSIERVDLAQNFSAYEFQTTTDGFQVMSGGNAVATFPGTPSGGLDLRAADGNVTVAQTGVETFTITNPANQQETQDLSNGDNPAGLNIGTGSDVSEDAGPQQGDGSGNEITLSASRTGPIDASGDDFTFDFESGNYTATIQNFDSGDQLDLGEASMTVLTDTDQSDGVQTFELAESGNVATVELTGLTGMQDSELFKAPQFDAVFGADTLI